MSLPPVTTYPILRLCLAAAALGATGCGSDPTATSANPPVVSDSAGVRMVTNSGPDLPLSISEVLRIGVVEGDPEYQFDGIRVISIDPLDGLWVIDRNPSVRHFGADGRLIGTAGRRGEGRKMRVAQR